MKTVFLYCLAILILSGCDSSPSPYQLAEAERMRSGTAATATVDAIKAEALATTEAAGAKATKAISEAQVQGTATAIGNAIQNNARVVASEADRQIGKNYSVVGWQIVFIVCFFLTGMAAVALIRRESITVRRDKLGKLPALLRANGRTEVPDQAISPVLTATNQTDLLFQLYRFYQFCKTGKVPNQRGWTVEKHDEGVPGTAYAALATENVRTNTMTALMQPTMKEPVRKDRLRLVQNSGGGVMGALRGPQVETIIDTDDAARVAGELGKYIEAHPTMELPAPQDERGMMVGAPIAREIEQVG